MKIFVVTSTQFYSEVSKVEKILKEKGHSIVYPNGYNDEEFNKKFKNLNPEEILKFKADLIRLSENKVKNVDAVLVLNYDKIKNNVVFKNYIGGATFLEIYNAFRLNKKIFFINEIPDGIIKDELEAFEPTIINENFDMYF